MNDSLVVLFAEIFTGLQDKGSNGYVIIKSGVAMKILWNLYERLSLIDVPTIDGLPLKQKEKYWNIGKEFYELQEDRIKASKAAYMISLITNTD